MCCESQKKRGLTTAEKPWQRPRSWNGPVGGIAAWLMPFAGPLTRPTWRRVLVLVEGALPTSHRRTARAALRAAGSRRRQPWSVTSFETSSPLADTSTISRHLYDDVSDLARYVE